MSDGERRLDNVRADNASSNNDNFGDARMAAPIKVAYNDLPAGMPACQDIIPTINQMGANNHQMLTKMDQFTHGSFARQGVTLAELEDMKARGNFSSGEKKALDIMIKGFKLAPNEDGNANRMNVTEFAHFLQVSAIKQECHFPGMDQQRQQQQQPPQNGGMRRKG